MSDAPTYEQLLALVGELSVRNEEQARVIAEQAERIAELERRLGQNSNNSSLPPSSDRFGRPKPGSLRGKTGRRPGKQPGSPGAALRQVADPDEVVEYVPAACAGCGADLAGADDAGVLRRQVHDIPQVTTRVVEHRLHKRRCVRPGCGSVTTAAAPAGVSAPVSYGPNLRALAVYLVARAGGLSGGVPARPGRARRPVDRRRDRGAMLHRLDQQRARPNRRGAGQRRGVRGDPSLCTRYRDGATVYDLAERFSIHRTTVSGHLHRQGIKMRGHSLDETQVHVAIALYEQGWSTAWIGRHLGVNCSTVWLALRAREVRMRDAQGRERW